MVRKWFHRLLFKATLGEGDGILTGKEKEPYCLFLPSTSDLFSFPLSGWAVRCEEEDEEEAGLFSSSPTTSELPAGSELFYALVVTGRFIRLEICTNQLSFSGSCQCVKLSGPAVREMP